jgi:hypothetical protein
MYLSPSSLFKPTFPILLNPMFPILNYRSLVSTAVLTLRTTSSCAWRNTRMDGKAVTKWSLHSCCSLVQSTCRGSTHAHIIHVSLCLHRSMPA